MLMSSILLSITEASYASKKKKPIIPLLMEANYEPDGWLGILLGTKLYYNFFSDEHMASSMESLIKEIGNRGRANRSTDEIDSKKFVLLLFCVLHDFHLCIHQAQIVGWM